MEKHDKKDETALRYSECGEFENAASLIQENLTWSKNARGPRDLVTLEDQESLSFNLHELGRYEQAEALDRQTLQVRRKDQGFRHADTLETQHNLALNLFKLGRYTEAAELDRRTLKARETALGRDENLSLSSRHNLAASLQELKLYAEAAGLNCETLRIRERRCGKDDDDLIASRHNLATNLHGLAQYDDAANLLQRNLDVLRKRRTKNDPQLVRNEQTSTIISKALDRLKKLEEDGRKSHRNQIKTSNTRTPHEPKLSEQKAAPKLEMDKERTVANAGRDHTVANGHKHRNNDSPGTIRTKADSATATHGSNKQESVGAEIQRSFGIDHERRPRKEGRREEPQRPTVTEAIIRNPRGIPKNDGPANKLGPIPSQEQASSVSEAVMPHSTSIKAASTPTIFLPLGKRNADQGKYQEAVLYGDMH